VLEIGNYPLLYQELAKREEQHGQHVLAKQYKLLYNRSMFKSTQLNEQSILLAIAVEPVQMTTIKPKEEADYFETTAVPILISGGSIK